MKLGYENEGRHQGKAVRRKRKIAVIVGLVIVGILILVFSSFFVLKSVGKAGLKKNASSKGITVNEEVAQQDEDDSGIVYYNGEKYKYNDSILTLLFMGVDKKGNMDATESIGAGGQADVIFLMVLDGKNNQMKLIGISRDTMTDISIYDHFGNFYDKSQEQLALQFAYGDGKTLSAELMVEAVTNLMYGLPIHGYCAINMEAVPVINDEVGGVVVTLAEDMPEISKNWKQGDSITLKGADALTYIRQRNCDEPESNSQRMERQKNYILSFITSAKNAIKQDMSLTLGVYNTISQYMVTDITPDRAVYLATQAAGASFDTQNIRMVEGSIENNGSLEEFHTDNDKLFKLIIDTFYEKQEQ